MTVIGVAIVWAIITSLVLFLVIQTPKTAREHPTWCHIGKDLSASGYCKNIPGFWWAV